MRLPDSVTETELLRTIMDASVKEPLAKANLELRRKLVDEETKAAAKVTQKFEEIKANLAVKYEGEALDPEQEFDAPDNIKGWQKEDRKLFKDAKTKANKANEKLTARHKSIEEAQNELSAAVAFDRDVVMPPRIKLLPHNEAGYKIGHVMFEDVCQMAKVIRDLTRTVTHPLENNRKVCTGVRLQTAAVLPEVAAKAKQALDHFTVQKALFDSQDAHEDELKDAEFAVKLTGDGVRLKHTTDGVNVVAPNYLDAGNVCVQAKRARRRSWPPENILLLATSLMCSAAVVLGRAPPTNLLCARSLAGTWSTAAQASAGRPTRP